ncbi:DOPA 4,5-dioxygenase [Wickerhamomyces ciferrii]|uniref:DOPA 4,5-dioxygenase n=1 Tax=Wickerhamomyces ciferrii (strain ATCC 14091 / BCRC 22168 / CBS 111 / JCM 3599 / NBRC 0793 / NRRL Y-1031 F-60-10) TaxID=1206466 RepID=K0KWD5_WICCF|nr:DOPA 4,5-dioxygenase [Wickerhamomyces ciferrii]CCH45799.1 DOPA 4,5-dioxygenase [Wickerhamomyces ciferrii]
MTFFEPIKSYDFHIYYNQESKQEAINLKNSIFKDFEQEIDSDELIIKFLKSDSITGPHFSSFFEVDLENPLLFAKFYSWIQLQHPSLSILIHPNSGDALKDHTIHTSWYNKPVKLNEDVLKGHYGYPEFGFPKRDVILNGYYDGETKGIMIRLLNAKDGFNQV